MKGTAAVEEGQKRRAEQEAGLSIRCFSIKNVTPDMYALRQSYFFGSLIDERKGTEGKATTKALGTL